MWQIRALFDDRICGGIWLNNIYLGDMRQDDAQKTIEKWRQNQPETAITLTEGNSVFKLYLKDIDFEVDAKTIAEAAFRKGRDGSFKNRVKEIYRAKKEGILIPLHIKYNEAKLENILYKLKVSKDKQPKNVSVSFLTRKITPEEWGQKLDAELLRKQIIERLYLLKDTALIMPIIPVAPKMIAADLAKNGLDKMMASYATTFNAADKNRSDNVRLAARKINGTTLFPGEIFSFNEIVGPRETEYGFKEAMELVGGEFVPGIGGGVCQVSSTLYNAALLAGLKVTERTNHSRPLRYVPPGRDATVAYGSIDFKFINNNLLPIMVVAETSGERLYVGILGRQFFKDHLEEVTFEIITADEKIVSLKETNEINNAENSRYEISILRITRNEAGLEIKKELLSRDKYLPDSTI
jgi:vancomycin resistance protein VanW